MLEIFLFFCVHYILFTFVEAPKPQLEAPSITIIPSKIAPYGYAPVRFEKLRNKMFLSGTDLSIIKLILFLYIKRLRKELCSNVIYS
jgi:hypothetical protein